MTNQIKLFNHCIPVKGIERSIINDLQRGGYKFIPNSLHEILYNYDGSSVESIKKAYQNKYDEIIDEYFTFLIENEYAFLTNESELFPNLNLDWRAPSYITNAILCLNQNGTYDLSNILKRLEVLNCKALQFLSFATLSLQEINEILHLCFDSRFISIELILPYNAEITFKKWKDLFYEHQRLNKVLNFNASENSIEYIDKQKAHPIVYTTENMVDNSFCGNIHPNNFVQNIPFFTESQHYNTCLNRKVSIDEAGNIKNCLSMSKSYGNIKDVDLKEVVTSKEFQKLWSIKKDDIKVCKVCEFRHMCMDCRAYIKDSDDIYSQPAKCSFNPYIAKWKGQDGYISVEEWQEKNKEVKA